ncbi:MAG TPA: choice-of-anchor Q domain-containing protein [Polyangia bacterium]
MGVKMDDNLVEALSGGSYVSGDTGSMPAISGSNNLLDGAGAAPPYLTGSVSGAPLFANAAGGDFHLTPQSPAVDHGKTTAAPTDVDGNPRPQGAAFDIGAYELVP